VVHHRTWLLRMRESRRSHRMPVLQRGHLRRGRARAVGETRRRTTG
jgi:hypothetical protein